MPAQIFIAVGDIHDKLANLERIPELKTAAGIIITGDMTNRGGPEEVEFILNTASRLAPRLYAQIGNMDKPGSEAALDSMGVNIHRRGLELAPGVGLMGVGWSTPTPFGTPSEVPEWVLEGWLEETFAQVKNYPRFVLVCHTPPKDTATDVIRGGTHVGSQVVRAFIEKRAPVVCLTGHIHEARATDRIGPTLVVNPGMLSKGGYALLTVDGDEVGVELKALD